ncbi:MAG: glycosyltransferase family 39 protein [Zetaproteobacteria bacterium]|nr:glycosyltransferase family 39 protein [Zetaproteobacteria bacterium]
MVGRWIYPNRVLFLMALSIITVLALKAGLEQASSRTEGTLEYPPVYGGGDQGDYLNMGYAFSQFTRIGKKYDDAFFKPFEEAKKAEVVKDKSRTERFETQLNYNRQPSHTPPFSYTYRPWLYPVLLGTTFKIFGYSFTSARMVNVVLFVLCVIVVFLGGCQASSLLAGVCASLAMIYHDTLVFYCSQLLTEILAATILIMVLLFSTYASQRKTYTNGWFLTIGLALGAALYSRNIFYFVNPLILLALAFILWSQQQTLQSICKRIACAVIGYLCFVVPWMSYNIQSTGSYELATGTQGYIGIIMGYDARYLLPETNKYQLRTQILNEYTARNQLQPVKGGVEMALRHKKIFAEQIRAPGFWTELLPQLVRHKFLEVTSTRGDKIQWLLRALALLGLLSVSLPMRAIGLGIFSGFILAGCIFVPDEGRFFIPTYPLVAFFAGIGVMAIARWLQSKASTGLGLHRKKEKFRLADVLFHS